MKIDTHSPSFSGYSQVLGSELRSATERHLLLSMKLDDIGAKDLTAFKQLKEMQRLPREVVNNDVLTILFSKVDNSLNLFFCNGIRMHSGSGLIKMESKAVKPNEIANYKREEEIHMKLYTFLANLTRRLMNENNTKIRIDNALDNPINKENYNRVCIFTQNTLTNIFQNERASYEFMSAALNGENIPFQIVAKKINDKIANTMNAFFNN